MSISMKSQLASACITPPQSLPWNGELTEQQHTCSLSHKEWGNLVLTIPFQIESLYSVSVCQNMKHFSTYNCKSGQIVNQKSLTAFNCLHPYSSPNCLHPCSSPNTCESLFWQSCLELLLALFVTCGCVHHVVLLHHGVLCEADLSQGRESSKHFCTSLL